jgi:hypothetical protein
VLCQPLRPTAPLIVVPLKVLWRALIGVVSRAVKPNRCANHLSPFYSVEFGVLPTTGPFQICTAGYP